jgi:Gpi18-like mannosyltransferase
MSIAHDWTTDEKTAFAIVLLAGLVIRLGLFTHSGYLTDTQIFEGWAARGATYGIFSMYDQTLPGPLPDYPPLLLYLYSLVGLSVRAVQGSFEHTVVFAAAMKTPGIIADVITLCVLTLVGRQLHSRTKGITAGAIFFLLPASWLDSTIWGQYDAIYSLILLIAFFCAGARRPIIAGCCAGLAVTAKFQVVAFLPFLLLIAASAGWRDVWRGVMAFAITIAVVFVPFLATGHGHEIVSAYGHAVGAYSVLSIDAFNVWRVMFGSDARRISDLIHAGGISYRMWGFLIYLAAAVVVMGIMWRRLAGLAQSERIHAALNAGAIAAFLFFLFPTEIHERYLFAFLPLASIWATRRLAEISLYCLVSVLIAINIAMVLPIAALEPVYAGIPYLDRVLSGLLILTALIVTLMMLKGMAESRTLHTPRR